MNLPNCLSYQKKKNREFRDLGPFFKILLMIVYKIREKLPVFFLFSRTLHETIRTELTVST